MSELDSTGHVPNQMSTSSPERQRAADGRLRIAIVDDYELVVRGLHAMLAPARRSHHGGGARHRRHPEEHVDVALFDTFALP
ncbi:MAG: hypothetical protein R2697_19375 [Ilumatobacteraceae bacterium]